MPEELRGLLKDQIIEKFENYQARMEEKLNKLQKYNDEAISTERTLTRGRLQRLQNQLNKALPVTEHLKPFDLFYYKPTQSDASIFFICKKDSLRFDKYQLGVQIYELPDEHKIKDLKVILIAMFDYNRNFRGFCVRDRRMRDMHTFHTKGTSVCLGENVDAEKMINFEDGQSIVNGFNSMKDTLETINPESYLCAPEDMSERLQRTHRFIKNKLDEYNEALENEGNEGDDRNNDDYCPVCGEHYHNCTCAVCQYCEASLDPDSDICPSCGRTIN